ncbi:MAG: hypothetical protein R3F11_06655 [Verrucomicrobiales bacterium]
MNPPAYQPPRATETSKPNSKLVPPMNNEQSVWKGSPSQVLNLPALLLGAVVAGAVTAAALIFALPFAVPIIIAAWVVCLLPWAWKRAGTPSFTTTS